MTDSSEEATDSPGLSRPVRIGLAVGVAVLAIGAIALFLFFQDDAPPPLELDSLDDLEVEEPADPGDGTPTGRWEVLPGTVDDETTTSVGYRIEEIFAADTLKKTAVGRTPAVEGFLLIDGTQVTSAEFAADVTQLSSDSLRRDTYIANNALETNEFTEAVFVLAEPIELGEVPAHDEVVTATAVGDLTMHGVTRSVTLDLEAQWDGTVIQIVGSTHIVLADYGIEPPDIPGIVRVDPEGELELKLNLARPA